MQRSCDLRNLNSCKNWTIFSTMVFEAHCPLSKNDQEPMLRKQYENKHRLYIQSHLLLLLKINILDSLNQRLHQPLQPLQSFMNPPLLVQYKGRRPTKEPLRSKSVLCPSRITHRHRNLVPLLQAHLLESCPPFSIIYFVISPLVCIQILLYYLCETSSSKSRFSRGFIFSLMTKVWRVQCLSQYFIPALPMIPLDFGQDCLSTLWKQR